MKDSRTGVGGTRLRPDSFSLLPPASPGSPLDPARGLLQPLLTDLEDFVYDHRLHGTLTTEHAWNGYLLTKRARVAWC
jgi:hypothetical protein